MKKKIWIPIIIVAILLIGTSIVYYVSVDDIVPSQKEIEQLGSDIVQIQQEYADSVIATVNGEPISKIQLENRKLTPSYTGTKEDEQRIFYDILRGELFYQEAINRGYSASEEDVAEYTKMMRSQIEAEAAKGNESATETYAMIFEYIKAAGMTEDEYWEQSKITYHKSLTTGNFANALRAEYEEKNNLTQQEAQKEFQAYYNSFTRELYDRAEIEIFDKSLISEKALDEVFNKAIQ